MAAGRCVDTFVISLIADLDCHLEITNPLGDDTTGDMQEFIISPDNDQILEFSFDYYIGIGSIPSHADYGFHHTIDTLNVGNMTAMSISAGLFNPPTPDGTGAPSLLKSGTLRFTAVADTTFTVGPAGANSQNLSGEIILNTGITEP